jgi:hypothetical protein
VARFAAKRAAVGIAGAAAAAGAGYNHLRKKHAGAKRVTNEKDTGVGAEFTKQVVTFGKYKKEHIPKILRATIQTVVCRMTNCNQYDNVASATTLPGSLALANWQINGAGNTAVPLVMFDVTSWINNIQGTLTYSTPGFNLNFDPSGNVVFNQIGGAWALEHTSAPAASSGTAPNASDLLKSVQLRMLFYGATAKPTKFSIDLVSIKDDYLHPDSANVAQSAAQSADGINLQSDRNLFWQTQVRPYIFSPLVLGDPINAKGKMKVHKHTEFLLQEKLTNEPTSFSGHMHQLMYNLHLDRIQKYDWNDPSFQTPNALENAYLTPNIALPTTTVSPRARLYVMIRAQSTFNTSGSLDPSKNPSFDIIMRGVHQNVV